MNSKFILKDLIGSNPKGIISYNSKYNIIAYSIGSIIFIKGIENSSLNNFLYHHEANIGLVKFSTCNDYIYSIDMSVKTTLAIWSVSEMKVIYSIILPINTSNFINENQFLRVNNNEYKDHYDHSKLISTTFTKKGVNSTEITNILLDQFVDNGNKLAFIIIISLSNDSSQIILMEYLKNKNISNIIFEKSVDYNDKTQHILNLFCFKKSYKMNDFLQINNGDIYKNKHLNIENKGKYLFITSEIRSFTIWYYNDHNLKSLTKVHTEDDIMINSLSICESLKMIAVIIKGCSVIFDFNGNFIVNLTCDRNNRTESKEILSKTFNDCIFTKENFTSQSIFDESLLTTTNNGCILIYSLSSFKLITYIPFSVSIKENFNYKNINEIVYNRTENEYEKEFENSYSMSVSSLKSKLNKQQILQNKCEKTYNISINFCFVNISKNLIFIKFSDNNLIINSLNAFLEKYSKNKINSKLLGLKSNDSINYQKSKNDNLNKYYSLSHLNMIKSIICVDSYIDSFKEFGKEKESLFITASLDSSIRLWYYKGDLLFCNYFDINSLYHKNLSIHSKTIDNHMKYGITCNVYCSIKQLLFFSDFNGNIYSYELRDKNIHFNYKNKITKYEIENIIVDKSEDFLLISCSNGICYLCDIKNECTIIVILCEQFNSNKNNYEDSFSFCGFIEILEENKLRKNYFNEYSPLKVIVAKNNMVLSLQNITKCSGKYMSTEVKEIIFKSSIKKCALHSNGNYIISLMNSNIINITKTQTGQLCGQINLSFFYIDSKIYDFEIDPSGLYIGILIDSIRVEFTKNENNFSKFDKLSKYSKFRRLNENSNLNFTSTLNKFEKSSVLFFEICTGKLCENLLNIHNISKMKFSNSGKNFIAADFNGNFSYWELNQEMKDNINNMLFNIRKNQNFWDKFAIDYDNNDFIFSNCLDDGKISDLCSKLNEENKTKQIVKVDNKSDLSEIYSNKKLFSELEKMSNINENKFGDEKQINDKIDIIKAINSQEKINPIFESKSEKEKLQNLNIEKIKENLENNSNYKNNNDVNDVTSPSIKNFSVHLDLQPNYIKEIISRKNYTINNNLKKNYQQKDYDYLKEPSDIDLMNESIPSQNPFAKKRMIVKEESTVIDNTRYRNNTTDEIEYAYDNIHRFDQDHNFV